MSNYYVDPTAIINAPLRFLEGCIQTKKRKKRETILPNKIYIGAYSVIGENVSLGEGVIIDSHCTIDPNTNIGDDTLVTYKATIGGNTIIGKNCVIGGYVPENCKIADRCRIFGNLVHTHNDTTMSWDHHENPEPSVTIHEDSFVGFGAIIAGGFEIGPKSYVCAGAIVTRTVPPFHIASGVNNIVHYTEWKGELKNNPIFQEI